MSDSDEAPEEVSFQASAASVRKAEGMRKNAVAASNRASKEKRRARDQRLKEQSLSKQKLALKKVLLEEEKKISSSKDSGESDSETNGERNLKPTVTKKPAKRVFSGVNVEVVKKPTTAKLPPAGKSAVTARDRFLFRAAVPRR